MPRCRTVPDRTGRADGKHGSRTQWRRSFRGPAGLHRDCKGGRIMPYVYGLVGFVVAIVLAIIVLQLLL
jgi:hypothetical protein